MTEKTSRAIVPLTQNALAPKEVKNQVALIQEIMRDAMQKDVHYWKIPGTNTPTLLQPGAQKIALTFQFTPLFEVNALDLGNGHREYEAACTLTHRDGTVLGQGVGNCNTMESKYRYRKSERNCPVCGQAAIIKGLDKYGGGWLCYKKKGGCGAKWDDGAQEIEGQQAGQVEHDNPADYYNTCKKMAAKRAYVHAVINTTGASDIFTQDVEDVPEFRQSESEVIEAEVEDVDVEPSEKTAPKKTKTNPKTKTKKPDAPPSQPVSDGKRAAIFAMVASHLKGDAAEATPEHLSLAGKFRHHVLKSLDDYGARQLLDAMSEGDFSEFEAYLEKNQGVENES